MTQTSQGRRIQVMMDIRPLGLPQQTLFADLNQKCMDAMFEGQFPENGSFGKRKRHNKEFWYYWGYRPASDGSAPQKYQKYVGPADDPAIARIVENFQQVKTGYRERRETVSMLKTAGLPSPPAFVGDIIESLWKGGFFRLRGLMVGTAAFQAYAGILGVKFPSGSLMTGDVDFAQFHSISMLVEDTIPPVLETLKSIDPSFREVAHVLDSRRTIALINAKGFKVEFLTPNRGADDNAGHAAAMPALGGISAQPLRYLDFLIYNPVRSVILHKGGVPVTVPSPARYAIHKLIVSNLRRHDTGGREKSRKDVMQAGIIADAMTLTRQEADLGYAWMEAWNRGPKWQENLMGALDVVGERQQDVFRAAVEVACAEDGRELANFGFGSSLNRTHN